MGGLLILLALGLFFEERYVSRHFPIFFFLVFIVQFLAGLELFRMIPKADQPRKLSTFLGLILFSPVCFVAFINYGSRPVDFAFFALLIAGFIALLTELWYFRAEDRNFIPRVALALFFYFYLGFLGSFIELLRILPNEGKIYPSKSSWSLLLFIAVVKCNDIGAYFTGTLLCNRVLGRHLMAPMLSPKKTWEGFVGGMLSSIAVSIWIVQASDLKQGSLLFALEFGITVGIAGVLGDLTESMIKREYHIKDASKTIPGFGGILDVIDSLLFAAPAAYFWLR